MASTSYQITGDDFLINGHKTYTEIPDSDPKIHGLLFNARFIQGVFEDKNPANAGKYDRFGKIYDAGRNTRELVEALPAWYESGLRAITVGLQGGGPIFTYEDWSVIDSGCFSADGKIMDKGYQKRLEEILEACDKLGMLVIVSILYQAQAHLLKDGVALVQSVRTACEYLKSLPYDNIIIEVANEHDVGDFQNHPMIGTAEGMANLICLAKEWSGHRFAVGSSGGGGSFYPLIGQYSDVILVHGNDLRTQEYARFIGKVRTACPGKPIVCNEDSPLYSQLSVSYATHTSWGYYNNLTKQEPPAFWEIRKGEDTYFAERLQQIIHGGAIQENQYVLEGLEEDTVIEGRHYVKVAARYPEQIRYVEYYEDGVLLDTAFDQPFLMYALTTWEQKPYVPSEGAKEFEAKVALATGESLVLTKQL